MSNVSQLKRHELFDEHSKEVIVLEKIGFCQILREVEENDKLLVVVTNILGEPLMVKIDHKINFFLI